VEPAVGNQRDNPVGIRWKTLPRLWTEAVDDGAMDEAEVAYWMSSRFRLPPL
jgi:hypothetical protein